MPNRSHYYDNNAIKEISVKDKLSEMPKCSVLQQIKNPKRIQTAPRQALLIKFPMIVFAW